MAEVSYSHSVLSQLLNKVFLLSDLYYQNKVLATSKGLLLELVKILSDSIVIDFSNNMFQGQIPNEIGQLKALYVLNMSLNAFTGEIPLSIGNSILLFKPFPSLPSSPKLHLTNITLNNLSHCTCLTTNSVARFLCNLLV